MSDIEVKQRLMRPFVKRAMATANGWWDGTTVVAPQVPALGEFGLGEADDFWRDAEILLLTGDMKDQLRRVTGYVQATGTLTLDHRFNHPNVSLLTVNSPAADHFIDVVDASLFTGGSLLTADVAFGDLVVNVVDASNFRLGQSVIEDGAPAAEMVVIVNVDTVLNQLTLVAPGITAVGGYTVANAAVIAMQNNAYIFDAIGTAESVTILGINLVANQLRISMPGIIAAGGYNTAAGAAISVSPQILGPIIGPPAALGTMFLIMTPLMMTGADGSKVQLTDWVDDGEILPDGSMPVAPAKVTLAAFDDLANVAAVADAALVGLNTDHRGEGANSTEWNKLGTGVRGGVAYTPPAAIDISKYSTHAKVMAFMYIPTPVGTIDHLYIALGTDAANLFYWEVPLADIVYDAWNHHHMLMSEVDGVLGVGADLSAIQHVGIYVETALAAGTVTGILVDEVVVKRSFETFLNQKEGVPLEVEVVAAGTEEPLWLVTDKDAEFTGALAINVKEDEDLAGLAANKIVITDVMFEGVENLQFYLMFWSTDAFEDADLDVDSFLGFVDLDIPNNGFQIGAANQFYINVTDLNLHYSDDDGTNELHVSLLCISAAGKQAGAPGAVKVKIAYKVRT